MPGSEKVLAAPLMVHKSPGRMDGRPEFAIHANGPRQNGNGDTVFTVATLIPTYEPAKRPFVHDYTPDGAEAFANLFAAAPEMLKALKRSHACATLRDDGTCDGCFVSEAIAKAEGRQ